MERIHSRRYRGNGAFSEQRGNLCGTIIRLQKNAFGREAQCLSGDFRGLGCGSGSGSGDALGLQQLAKARREAAETVFVFML